MDSPAEVKDQKMNNRLSIEEMEEKIKTSTSPSARPQLITDWCLSVLETSKLDRLQRGYLFGKLVQRGSLSVEDYCSSLEIVLKEADELAIDVPRVWDYIAELVFPVLCEGAIEMRNLHKLFNLLVHKPHAAKLLTCLFKLMIIGNEENSTLTIADYTNVASNVLKIPSLIPSPSVEPNPDPPQAQLTKVLEEYLNDRYSIQECLQHIKTSISPSEISQLVSLGTYSVLKKSKMSRLRTGFLFAQLLNSDILSISNYCIGLESIFKEADQLVIDVPQVWSSVAELLSPVVCDNAVTLSDLHNLFKLLVSNNNHAPELLKSLFKLIIQDKGITFLQNIWNNSNFTFDDYMDEPQVDNFVKQNNFEFLLKTEASTLVLTNLKDGSQEGTDVDAFKDDTVGENAGTAYHTPSTSSVIPSDYLNNVNTVMPFTVINDSNKQAKNNPVSTVKPANIKTLSKKVEVADIVKGLPKLIKTIVPNLGECQDEPDHAALAKEKMGQAKNETNAKASAEAIIDIKAGTKINLPYKHGQWSPYNKDGKKVYDRDFLLALRKDPKSNKKPDNLPADILANEDRGAMNSVPVTPRRDERFGGGGGGGGGFGINASADKTRSRNVSKDDGWSTAPSRSSRTPFSVQSDKLKNKAPMMDEPLGSIQMFGNWGRGSNIKTQPPLTNTANMYAALENIGTESDKRPALGLRMNNKDPYSSKGPSLERNYRQPFEEGRGSRSGSQHRSRDSSTASQRQTTPAPVPSAPKAQPPTGAPPVPAPVELTPDQLERRLKNILEEYLNDCCSVQECDQDIKISIAPSALPQLVSDGYISVLERSKTARLRTGYLFAQLIKVGTLTLQDYCVGLEAVLEEADELIIDIPRVWDYVAELISPVLCESSATLQDLHKSFEPLVSKNHASKLLVCLFKLIIQEKGPNFLQSSWNSSGFTFADYMAESQVDSYVKENNFEFLLEAGDSSPVSQSHSPLLGQTQLSYEEMHEKLLSFFQSGTSFDDIINWIAANVGERVKENPFIRTLATACFNDSIVNLKLKADILQGKYNLLHRFVDNKPAYELQCLYALQALINKLEHPQGLLLAICDKLYEENVFSHESFVAWEASKDPAEQEGKGVALKQLTSFFTQLKEADEDSSSSEEA